MTQRLTDMQAPAYSQALICMSLLEYPRPWCVEIPFTNILLLFKVRVLDNKPRVFLQTYWGLCEHTSAIVNLDVSCAVCVNNVKLFPEWYYHS